MVIRARGKIKPKNRAYKRQVDGRWKYVYTTFK